MVEFAVLMPRRRKITLVMEESVVYGIRDAVEAGLAKSQSGLVHDAVLEYLDAARRRALAESYDAAASDPEFLKDVERVRKDFEHADEVLPEP
jgi:Arc/MetJ-type ribon-helix-helix transcriptional regulator